MNLNILYEDNHVIVVEKLVGVLSQADQTNDQDMLTLIKNYIKKKYNKPGNVYLGLVHRLDRMVGGIMVFAKTSKAASRLSEQVRTRQIKKEYYAVLNGVIDQKEGTLVNYLLKNKKTNMVKVVSEDTKGSKYAELSYKVIGFKDSLSLVKINLKTGRPHQIRVQFSHLGYPLYGDRRYGQASHQGNIALYAYSLSFYHPTKKEELSFQITPNHKPFDKFTF